METIEGLRVERWMLFTRHERDWLKRVIKDEMPTDTRQRMLDEIEVADRAVLRRDLNRLGEAQHG